MTDINWTLVNQLVPKEHQYLNVKEPPLDLVRMAWPFKTEEELRILSKWFREQVRETKKKQMKEHIDTYGDALL